MCFAIFLDLNIFLEEVGKSFVDAGGASTALKILQRISQFILKIDLIHRKYSDTPSIRSDTPDICSDIGSNTRILQEYVRILWSILLTRPYKFSK